LRLLWPRDAKSGYRILNVELLRRGQERHAIVVEDQDGRTLLSLDDCCVIGGGRSITQGAVAYYLETMPCLDDLLPEPGTPPQP
jgi:hypothetical protein